MRGEQGTTLTLVAADRAGTETAETAVQRRQYDTPSIETAQGETDTIGYIKIITFNQNTAAEVRSAIENMQNAPQGLLGLVVDVRNNAGGSMKYVLDVIDELCPVGPMGYQTDAAGEMTVLGISDDANAIALPVAVLINSGTSAGAELFAADLREFGVAQLVGTTTAGKGSVQCTPVRLSDGSAISYTVGVLSTSTESSFNDIGITPDVEVVLQPEEEKNFYDLTVDSDSQIRRAKEVLAGIITKGDGGQVGGVTAQLPVDSAASDAASDSTSDSASDADASGSEA